MWFFAPPRACTRLPWRVPVSYTCRATGVLPTNETAATSRCPNRASTASPSPCTTLRTPSGKPARCTRSARTSEADGSFSEGFSTKQLPQAMALAIIHRGTMTGKLNGVMPATTPRGSSTVRMSTPVEISELDEPFSWLRMPHANSTFSMPRATSPRASSSTLPCSRVTAAASSSRLASSSSRRRNREPVRRVNEEELQARRRLDRRLHGGVDLRGRCQGDLGRLDSERRVVDGGGAAGRPWDQRPRDPVPDRCQRGASLSEPVELARILAEDLTASLGRERLHLRLHAL